VAGYSATPLWKKLGVRAESSLLLLDAPAGWSVAELPEGVAGTRESSAEGIGGAPADVIVAFHAALEEMRRNLPALGRRIFPVGAIWVAWPRRAAGHESDIREQDIRDVALPLGLVDVKVAALDQDWSGLRLVWRKELRQASPATPG
jgi:hypothetical protein